MDVLRRNNVKVSGRGDGQAMMFVSVDDALDATVLDRVREVDGMVDARVVELPAPRQD